MDLDEDQRKCLARMQEPNASNVWIIWWLMGTGKTRLGLAAFEVSGYNLLVVVTRRVAFSSWVTEIEKCGLGYTVFYNDLNMDSIHKIGSTKKKVLLMSASNLNKRPVFSFDCMLLVDELYLFGNPESKRSRQIHQIAPLCSCRIGLSGTIMPARDNITIYGQLKALGVHKFLSKTLTAFREEFQDRFKVNFGTISKNKPGSLELIKKRISSFVDINFPEKRPFNRQIITVHATKEQKSAIKELKELYTYKGKEFKYASEVLHAINGISDGWFGSDVDIDCQKFEALVGLVQDIVANGSLCVIWCAYHNDIGYLRKRLKVPFLEFTGKTQFNEHAWNEGKGEYQVVLATEGNGASVNFFAQVPYAIYYSINYKNLDLEQSMTRHERKSSMHAQAMYYFLHTEGTYDKKIYDLVAVSKKSEEQIIKILSSELDKNI